MNIELLKKIKILTIFIVLLDIAFLPNIAAISDINMQFFNKNKDIQNFENKGSEYWALLVAVGVYADKPQQNRPLMLEEVDDLYDVLLQSNIWSEDHIKVIKGEEATCSNIISGLKWLDKMEDEDDFSLVFFSTHGSPAGTDIFPFDEEDGTDEILVSYWGFAYPGLYIWDDQLNFRLNQLESQGVCLIVDSCYAGGFNDPPGWIKTSKNINKITTEDWIEGFGGELSGQKRVVLMASREDELSYSGGFAPYLIDGLRGYADDNSDDIVTAEEVFFYTQPRASRQHPTIYDGYPGEFPLIYLTDSSKNPKKNKDISNKKNIISTLNCMNFVENSIINGYIKDANTANPIEDALINVRGRDNEGEFFENETISDSYGFYNINVPPCRCWINVYADGYCDGQSDFLEIDENEVLWINFSLNPRPQENSIICGYINDEKTDNPVEGANVSLFWQGDQYQFYMNDTNSDKTGFYSINVAAGEIDLEVDAKGYFREILDEIIISGNETIWANFSLYSFPLENSVICGYITDKDSGSPINNTQLTFEWNDITTGNAYQNETITDLSGFYSINIANGEIYHDIRKSGYYYYNPYRVDVIENGVLWMNISLEEETIEVDIAKPLKALYINNNRLFPYFKSRIIGKIDIEAIVNEDLWGSGSAQKVEFYIDGNLKETVTSKPYIWTWSEIKFGKHKIKVIAYDYEGNSDFKEIEVYKFL